MFRLAAAAAGARAPESGTAARCAALTTPGPLRASKVNMFRLLRDADAGGLLSWKTYALYWYDSM